MKKTSLIFCIFGFLFVAAIGLPLKAQSTLSVEMTTSTTDNETNVQSGVQADVQSDEQQANSATSTPEPEVAQSNEPKCIPDCREGFMCHKGICVSACNPPCSAGFLCTAALQCERESNTAVVPSIAPAVSAEERQKRREIRRLEKLKIRKEYRKIPRVLFSTDLGAGALRNGDILEASFRVGAGFRMNFIEKFGLILRTSLVIAMWEDETVSETEQDYYAETSTSVLGFDVELFPYVGPFSRFYFGPVVNLRGMYPTEKSIIVEVDSYYGADETVYFRNALFASYGFGSGVLLGSKESINVNWRFMSSFTQRMPIYVQVGVSFDLPLRGDN